MSFNIPSSLLALTIGFSFGWLLHRGKVTNCDVLANQFRLRDFTVLKIMLTAIIVGGFGVLALINVGEAKYYIKDANLLGVILGAVLFGIGLILYGYCPGTGLAAIATGSVHALVGALGMIAGAILYAMMFDWLKENILNVWTYGKVRLPDITGIPDVIFLGGLAFCAVVFFCILERKR